MRWRGHAHTLACNDHRLSSTCQRKLVVVAVGVAVVAAVGVVVAVVVAVVARVGVGVGVAVVAGVGVGVGVGVAAEVVVERAQDPLRVRVARRLGRRQCYWARWHCGRVRIVA